MSSYSKHSLFRHWRSTLWGTVASITCWSALPSAYAQQPESPALFAFLSVPPIPLELARGNCGEQTGLRALTEQERQSMLTTHRAATNAEAWEHFVAEYSPAQKNPSLIKRQIETGKYGLDTAVFAVDRFVKNVQNEADFSFDRGSLRRTREVSLEGARNNPRVKLDVENGQSVRPYLGVRFIIPFGN